MLANHFCKLSAVVLMCFAGQAMAAKNVTHASVNCVAGPCVPAAVEMYGKSDAYNQIQYLDANLVRAWLPQQLELIASKTVEGKHPVIFIYQKVSEGVVSGFGSMPEYFEQAILIPSVRLVGTVTPRSYLAKVHTNDSLAVVAGRDGWAMEKYLAKLSEVKWGWNVTDITGVALTSAEFVPLASPTDISSFVAQNPNFVADLPFLGSAYISSSSATGPVCYELTYDLATTQFQSISANVESVTEYLPRLPLGTVSSSGLNDPVQHSLRINGPFTVSAAHVCN